MQSYYRFLFFITLQIFFSQGVLATDVLQCKDSEGGLSFQKYCPPGTIEVNRKKIFTGKTKSNEDNSGTDMAVTLYVIPNCEACIEVKELLQSKNIVFAEKDVSDSFPLQEELTEIAGSLGVPVTVIGEKVITGYQRGQIESILSGPSDPNADPTDPKNIDKADQ